MSSLSKLSKKANSALLVGGLTAMFGLGLVADEVATKKVFGADETVASAAINNRAPTSAEASNSYANIVSRVAPAVITVRSESRARVSQGNPLSDNPELREYFGGRIPQMQERQARKQSGLGSGVIVSSDGYILTNNHVVDEAEKITVQLNDQRTLNAKVIGTDAASDLAVLKIEARDLPVLSLGDSDAVRVGDVALAIGNPLGVGQTVTSGIISAKGRRTGLSDGSYEDFIQTDASINQGNSGGALINTNGELVGINSQILSPSGGNIGIGFAIPSNMAKNVMEQLVKTGKVRRGALGVTVQAVTSDIAQSLGLANTKGVIVGAVEAGSAAERAGIKRGDVITKFNGAGVDDSNAFRNHIAATMPNSEITLNIMRDKNEQIVRATLGERDAGKETNAGDNAEGKAAKGRLGIGVQNLTPELAAQLGLAADAKGVVIGEVAPDGAAAEAGLETGDVILEFNRQKVGSVEELQTQVAAANDKPVLLLVNRKGNTLFLTVKLQ